MRTLSRLPEQGPRPATTLGLLILAWVTSAFGNSLQPISALAWLHPLILLLAYERAVLSFRSSILAHILIILIQAGGTTFAFAGMLGYPKNTPASLLATFGFGTALATAQTLGALLPAAVLRRRGAELLPPRGFHLRRPVSLSGAGPPGVAAVGRLLLVLPLWAFPVLHGAVLTLSGYVTAHDTDPGVAISDWAPMLQLTSLFGLWGLTFIMDLMASAAFLMQTDEPLALEKLPRDPLQTDDGGYGSDGYGDEVTTLYGNPAYGHAPPVGPSHSWARLARPLRRHVAAAVAAVALLTVIGGGLSYQHQFWQRPIDELVAREQRLSASCLSEQGARVGSEAYVWLWQKTAERVQAGDHFVLWAEEAVDLDGDEQEAALLEQGAQLLRVHGSAAGPGGAYLGLCYQKWGGAGAPAGRSTNHFVLLGGPNGSLVWDYRKAYPVPVVEAQVVPGPPVLPTADSPYGRLGGAICFDLDRPSYIRQAGAARVDLLLQPSWTWGAVPQRHFAANSLRAVENGFTLLRCSSSGVSGAVSPRGVASQRLLTASRDALHFSLRLEPRASTAYLLFGWALEWANLAAAGLLWALALAPRALLARWVRQGGAVVGAGFYAGAGRGLGGRGVEEEDDEDDGVPVPWRGRRAPVDEEAAGVGASGGAGGASGPGSAGGRAGAEAGGGAEAGAGAPRQVGAKGWWGHLRRVLVTGSPATSAGGSSAGTAPGTAGDGGSPAHSDRGVEAPLLPQPAAGGRPSGLGAGARGLAD
ncbi:hypothetical protein HYH03_000453 [Edaphochlamys debaryana]|uniref:CN hydrolase domain-containing protein n=1 Tax=Edaphochlamys debaryana TaxID=47281 RepID=A0A836C6I8_9CHLO|nr:hypothetical protein HYH03_000453 [Edaphochlamys debaryana]|eukprot:KAG2501955.1 hypothetical protein HYH03_000453 [Edaphochlamys debaryana]